MDGYVIIGTKIDTKSFDAQIDYVEGQLQEIEYKLKQADMGFDVGDVQKLEAQYEKLVNQLEILRKKQADINKTDLSNIQKSIDKVGDTTSNVIKKLGKWTLAIFGIRSAYMFLRQTASTLAQYDEQIASDLEYMQFALANMLKPIIEDLIQLCFKLLTYVNYLAKAWFGIDLFANSSAKAMNKSAQSAEKMKKSLAGFDEMNILNDNGSTGAMGGLPSYDLSAPEDVEIPKWLIWIKENGSLIASIIAGISVASAALKLGFVTAPEALLLVIAIMEIVDVVNNLTKGVKGLAKWFKEPTWENFVQLLEDFLKNLGPIGDLILWIFDLFGGFEKVVEPLHNFYDWIKDTLIPNIGKFFSDLWKKIKEIFSPVIDFFANIFGTVGANIKTIVDNIKQIFSLLWKKIKEIFGPVVDFFKEKFTNAFKKIKEVFTPIVNFFSEIWNKVKTKLKDFGAKVGEVIGGAFKGVINGVLNAIENILNFPINSINKLISVINAVPGINLDKLNTFKLPRLAVGGIVNMPGRGVPVGGAIAGEAGAEGVIPLTDSQAMETLGQAIGRYITINANITNTMNGRVISRELQKVNNNNDFAFNR